MTTHRTIVSTPRGRPAERVQLDSLTGLRIFAALWVAMLHFRTVNDTTTFHYPVIDRLVLGGNLGVDLFFVLSGFILSHVYFDKFRERVRRGAYWSFISYRFARLYPVHLVTFLIMMALYVAQIVVTGRSSVEAPGRYSSMSIVQSLTMTHAWWGTDTTPNVPAWSISSEWFAYLLFPLLCLLVARWRPAGVAFVVAGLGMAAVFQAENPLLRVMAGFLVGMATFQLSRRTARLSRYPFLGTVITAMIVGWLLLGPARLEIGILLFATLILALAGGSDWLCRILSWKTVVYLGEVSYSVYMVHWIVRIVVRTGAERLGVAEVIPSAVVVTVDLVCTLAAAIVLYHLVERPWRSRLRDLLTGRPTTAHAASSG
jgi:peptidoglycan/LPS O-acetylase OafA/YrhL